MMRPGVASVWRAGAAVLAVHVAWIALFFAAGHEVRDFIRIGPLFVTRSEASDVIRFDPTYEYPANRLTGREGQGYDGQFAYYIALDPAQARHYLDDPAYRFSRILYPLAARALGLGTPDAIPWALLLINLLAIAGGTVALGAWLTRRGSSPWLALAYGFFPGLLVGLQRDLTEPLAYALVALAILLFDFGDRRGLLAAGGVFGLAVLARQTTVAFPLLFALSILAGRPNAAGTELGRSTRIRLTAAFSALAFVPGIAWAGVLQAWLGGVGAGQGNFTLIPFAGFLEPGWGLARQPPVILGLVLPTLVFAGVAVAAMRHGPGRLELACLLANGALAIVFVGPAVGESYTAAGRVATGVLLAAVLCLPYLREATAPMRRAVFAAFGLWLGMFPVVLAYNFWDIKV
jgi:hypothetical protein